VHSAIYVLFHEHFYPDSAAGSEMLMRFGNFFQFFWSGPVFGQIWHILGIVAWGDYEKFLLILGFFC